MNYTEPDKQEPVKDMGKPAADHRADKKKVQKEVFFWQTVSDTVWFDRSCIFILFGTCFYEFYPHPDQ